MAKNTSITLGEHFDAFIAKQLETGRFESASDVIKAGQHMLEDTENRIETLRNSLDKGEASGLTDYTYEEFIAEMDSENH